MNDHSTIVVICLLLGAWALLTAWAFGALTNKLNKLERELREIERTLKARRVA